MSIKRSCRRWANMSTTDKILIKAEELIAWHEENCKYISLLVNCCHAITGLELGGIVRNVELLNKMINNLAQENKEIFQLIKRKRRLYV